MRHPLIRVEEVPDNEAITAELMGREVLIMLVKGKPRAFSNVCMHHGGPLAFADDRLTCRWHRAQYDVQTGHALRGPVRLDARLIMLPTRVEGGVLMYVYED